MATGTIEIDFGLGIGAFEAQVAVTGQTAILATSYAESWVMAEASTDHSVDDHKHFQMFVGLTCSVPTAATGFTIYARTTERMRGKWKIRWVWL